MAKKFFLWLLKLAFSSSIILFIFYKYVDINDFIQTTRNINYLILPFLLSLIYFIRLLLAYQTKISLTPFNIYTSTRDIFKIHLVSTFYSLILPSDLIAGGVSWYLLSKESGRRAEVASVIAYLRVLNLITLLPFAWLGIYFEPKLKEYHIQFYTLTFGLLLLIMLLPFFWCKMAVLIESLFNYLISLIPLEKLSKRLLEANYNVWNSVRISREMPIDFTVKIIILSVIFQLITIISMYLTLEMVNIHLPLSVSAWLLAILAIIALIPLAIAGIGIRDISLVFVLKEFYSIPPESALLLSTVILLIGGIFFGGILGGYYAMTLGRNSNKATRFSETK
jgi:hypothetical protein